MAITFVSNALGGTTTTTTFSITLPTTAANDIIVLEYTHRATADATIGGTYTGPAFTEKHDQLYATSTFTGKTLWSRATGNHSGQTVTGSGLTDSCAAIVTVYRGCVTGSDPLADATIVGEQNASANETQAEITTTSAGAWVVLVVANSPDLAVTAQSCTSPGSLTARAEVLSTGGTDASIAHASAEKASAGGTGAFTWAQTNAASGSWAYALKPEPPAGTQTQRGALFARITATVSLAAALAQPIPNLNITTLATAAPTAHSLNLEAGSYSVSGAALTPLAGRSLNLQSGSYAFSGADLTLVHTPVAAMPFRQRDWPNPETGPPSLAPHIYQLRLPQEVEIAAYSLNLESGGYVISGADLGLVYAPVGAGPQTQRGPLLTKIVYPPSLAASLAQSFPNLNTTTLRVTPAYSLNLESGIYTLSGSALSPLAGRSLDLQPGSYAITGAALSPLAGRVIDLGAGSYLVNGAALTPLAGRGLNLESSSYIILGSDLTLVYTPVAAMPFRQRDWPNPQIESAFRHQVITRQFGEVVPGAYLLSLDAGAYLLSGADLSPLAGRAIDLGVGSYLITGAALTPVAGRFLSLDPGVYQVAGAALTPLAGRTLNLASGSYAISGAVLTSLAGRSLNLASGVYQITGAALSPIADRSINLESGAYVISAAEITLVFSGLPTAYSLNLEAGTYLLTGANAELVLGGAVAPISPGDEVMVIITGGIEVKVFKHDDGSSIPVRVVIESPKKITVLTEGGLPIKVTI